MRISVALCTYNGERFLSEQLDSIAGQTRPPDELVVRDDASEDETLEILDRFSRDAPFPVLIDAATERFGVVRNFDRVLESCSGDLIFLCDQDDVWQPDKIERMVERFQERPAVGLVATDATLVDESLQPLGRTLWSDRFETETRSRAVRKGAVEVILNHDVVTGATMAFRSKYLETIRPIPEGMPNLIHDKWIAFVIACQAEVEFLPECLTLYRQHAGQQIGASYGEQDDGAIPGGDVLGAGIEYNSARAAYMRELEAKVSQNTVSVSAKIRKRILDVLRDEALDADEGVRHFRNRAALKQMGIGKVSLIVQEVAARRYQRFSNGIKSALKDLLVHNGK
jgi:glycosyltransferase involved in cell wall biosynthesis